jgi:hypothetical protein
MGSWLLLIVIMCMQLQITIDIDEFTHHQSTFLIRNVFEKEKKDKDKH